MREPTWEFAMRLALGRWLKDHGHPAEGSALSRCRMSLVRVDPTAHLHVIIVAPAESFSELHPVARLGDWRAPPAALDNAWSEYLSGESAVIHFQFVGSAAA